MTDPTQPEDETISSYLDGEATLEEVARIEADPGLLAQVQEIRAVVELAAAPVEPLPPHTVDRLIDIALDQSTASSRVADLAALKAIRKFNAPRLAAVAATLVILAGAVGALIVINSNGDDDTYAGTNADSSANISADAADAAEELEGDAIPFNSGMAEESLAEDGGALAQSLPDSDDTAGAEEMSGGDMAADELASDDTAGDEEMDDDSDDMAGAEEMSDTVDAGRTEGGDETASSVRDKTSGGDLAADDGDDIADNKDTAFDDLAEAPATQANDEMPATEANDDSSDIADEEMGEATAAAGRQQLLELEIAESYETLDDLIEQTRSRWQELIAARATPDPDAVVDPRIVEQALAESPCGQAYISYFDRSSRSRGGDAINVSATNVNGDPVTVVVRTSGDTAELLAAAEPDCVVTLLATLTP